MSPVDAGRLRNRVTIQTATRTESVGGVTLDWSDDRTVYARVIQASAEGRARYQQAGYTNVTHVVTLRETAFTLADTRFVWRGRVLDPVAPPDRHDSVLRFMRVACREVTDDASEGS